MGVDVRGEPVIVFGMLDGMVAHLFTPGQLARLEACGRIAGPGADLGLGRRAAPTRCSRRPRSSSGHWGCPTLTAEVLDRAPELRLFAYGAGTVKWQVTDAVFERGIVVTSAAAANAVPVAEYAVAAILLANKGVFVVREQQRDPEARVTLDRAARRQLRQPRWGSSVRRSSAGS